MKEVNAKHILSPYGELKEYYGLNFNMNIYRGCCHGCIYCDSRSNCYRLTNFDEVTVKKDALNILENDLKNKRKKGIIGTGAMTDHYNPFEAKTQIMRQALQLIDKYGFGIGITTKSDLVARDKDILASISSHNPAFVNFTITTADDKLCKIIEPNVAITSKRLNAMKQLADAGVITGAMITPVLPFINDTEENLIKILKDVANAGGKYAYTFIGFGLTMRDGQREYFYKKLDEHFPGLKQKYINTYGNTYSCFSPNNAKLWQVFVKKCDELNLKYKMKDIVELIKDKYKKEQLSLFD